MVSCASLDWFGNPGNPYNIDRYWFEHTQQGLPTMPHVHGSSWTLKDLRGIWCEMHLLVKPTIRGQRKTMIEHLAGLNKMKTT